MEWLIFILGACTAGFVQGLTGFAFGLISISFWAWILPPQISAPLVVFASLWCHIIAFKSEPKSQLPFNLVLPYIIAGIIGIPIGTYLLDLVNAGIFKLILGIFLLIWCPIMFFGPSLNIPKNLSLWADSVVGFCAGILGGLGGFSGALPSVWVTLKNLSKDEKRFILRQFNFTIQIATIMVYLCKGHFSWQLTPYMLLIMIFVSLPAILGSKLFFKISEQHFKNLVLALLFASGLFMVLSQLR